MSSWGTRSQARCSGGPRARAASRDPASAPAAAPVATWRDTITTVEKVDLPALAVCGALAAPARRAQTASLLNRGRLPSARPDGLTVRPRRYAADAAYLPREVFFGRFALADAFFSVWANDFGRFFPATSRSFRFGCPDRVTLPPYGLLDPLGQDSRICRRGTPYATPRPLAAGVANELHHQAQLSLAQDRLDRPNNPRQPSDVRSLTSGERTLLRHKTGRDHLIATPQLISIDNRHARREQYAPAPRPSCRYRVGGRIPEQPPPSTPR